MPRINGEGQGGDPDPLINNNTKRRSAKASAPQGTEPVAGTQADESNPFGGALSEEASYTYTDETGAKLVQVRRREGKEDVTLVVEV